VHTRPAKEKSISKAIAQLSVFQSRSDSPFPPKNNPTSRKYYAEAAQKRPKIPKTAKHATPPKKTAKKSQKNRKNRKLFFKKGLTNKNRCGIIVKRSKRAQKNQYVAE
jgi:hypothetical protein